MSDENLVKHFKKTITRFGLLKKGDRILIAFSGGPDSMGLLALFLEIRDEWSLDLSLAHYHHMLREEADLDADYVRDVARRHSLPLSLEKRDVRDYARRKKLNLEEAGRILRYDFLKRMKNKIGSSKIATGHTLNDQAETFLIRLLRGSGRRGLSGIFGLVDDEIIRPLLLTSRDELTRFLARKHMAYRRDMSNSDPRFLRNRIRMELIPFLEKEYDPRIVFHLGQTALILQEEESLLENLAEKQAKSLLFREKNSLELDISKTADLPRGLSRRVVRDFLGDLKGDLAAVSFGDIENILHIQEGKKVSISGRTVLRREKDRIFLHTEDPGKGFHHRWDGKEPLEIAGRGIKVTGKTISFPAAPLSYDDNTGVHLDSATLSFPLVIRNRRQGDRYRPLGAPGSQKVKEIMRAKKIPLSDRDKLPVFLSGEEIIWIKGLPVSEKHKVTSRTKTVFSLVLDKA